MADDELIDDICDRWLEPNGVGGALYTDRYEIVPHVLAILRSLPVEQRMEAMGMEKVALSDMDVWVEAPYVAPY